MGFYSFGCSLTMFANYESALNLFQVLTALANAFHAIQPLKVPGFRFVLLCGLDNCFLFYIYIYLLFGTVTTFSLQIKMISCIFLTDNNICYIIHTYFQYHIIAFEAAILCG